MTQRQARALEALMRYVKPHHSLPSAADVVDGCYAAGSDGSTAHAIAESMNLWMLYRCTSASGAARLLEALVRSGFAARVFLPRFQAPRYIATQAGAAEYQRRIEESHEAHRS